jgi:hypothetical protein
VCDSGPLQKTIGAHQHQWNSVDGGQHHHIKACTTHCVCASSLLEPLNVAFAYRLSTDCPVDGVNKMRTATATAKAQGNEENQMRSLT